MSNHFLKVLSLVALLIAVAARGAGADATPEETLKAKGLVRVGFSYLLEADAKLGESLRALRSAQRKVDDAGRRRAAAQRNIDAADKVLTAAIQEENAAGQQLANTSKEALGNYNRAVVRANTARNQVAEAAMAREKREKEMRAIPDPSDEYLDAVQKTSALMEATAETYAKLAADEDVTAAIKSLNAPGKPKVKLGPSDQFVQELPGVRKAKESVASATITLALAGGVPWADVTLNDSLQLRMVVDSGAGMVSLSAETAKKLGLVPGPGDRTIEMHTADGKITREHVMTLKSVRVGPFTARDVQCAVAPASLKGVPDLLGGTFLSRFVYRMDLGAGELRLSQVVRPEADPTTRPSGASPVARAPSTPTPPADVPAPPAPAGAAARKLTLPADWHWSTGGPDVIQGRCYKVVVTGRWTDSNGSTCAPDGACPKEWLSPMGPQPGIGKEQKAQWYRGQHPQAALIGRIGTGDSFFVGKEATFLANASGALAFRMNDVDGDVPARSGKLELTVTEVQPQWVDARGATTVVARVDVEDRLHITAAGIFWEWAGRWSRVGEHEGHYPTVINGIYWWPKWESRTQTDVLPVPGFVASPEVRITRVESPRGTVTLEQALLGDVVLLFKKTKGLGSQQIGCALSFPKVSTAGGATATTPKPPASPTGTGLKPPASPPTSPPPTSPPTSVTEAPEVTPLAPPTVTTPTPTGPAANAPVKRPPGSNIFDETDAPGAPGDARAAAASLPLKLKSKRIVFVVALHSGRRAQFEQGMKDLAAALDALDPSQSFSIVASTYPSLEVLATGDDVVAASPDAVRQAKAFAAKHRMSTLRPGEEMMTRAMQMRPDEIVVLVNGFVDTTAATRGVLQKLNAQGGTVVNALFYPPTDFDPSKIAEALGVLTGDNRGTSWRRVGEGFERMGGSGG